MANPDLGLCDCPLCGKSGAHVRESSAKRAYILCEECDAQIFSRGIESDRLMRSLIEYGAVKVVEVARQLQPVEEVAEEVAQVETPKQKQPETIFDWLARGAK